VSIVAALEAGDRDL